MGERRTAWHYFLGVLLREKASPSFEIRAEEPLTQALQRIDWLVLRRKGPALSTEPGETLVELWPLLPAVSLGEFKSASKGYRPRDLHRLVGYGYQYFSTHADEIPTRKDMALVLMVGARSDTLSRDLLDLSLREQTLLPGYSRVEGLPFACLLVDFTALARRIPEEYIAPFSDDVSVREPARHWWYDHFGPDKMRDMKPQDLEEFDDLSRRFLEQFSTEQRLAGIAPEQRLAGIAPEQRLAGIAPEQRLAGLREEEQILALPDHLLRLLPERYLATLPAEVLSAVRRRLDH